LAAGVLLSEALLVGARFVALHVEVATTAKEEITIRCATSWTRNICGNASVVVHTELLASFNGLVSFIPCLPT
jgi:hypothetical protein